MTPATESFTELVYDREAWPFIKETWPQATFEDASDSIHEGRFSVTIPDITPMDFYPAIMLEGWAEACFGFELSMRLPERHDDVRAWLDAAKAIKESASS